jgi:alcohol dehydrogenase class IV
MPFEFATAGRIVFGPGAVREVAPAAMKLGRRALVVTGRSGGSADFLAVELRGCVYFRVTSEPTIEMVRSGVRAARAMSCDVVIGFGGGSVIDAGKAIAALLTNTGDVLDYLEVIGRGAPLLASSAPFIAVPTTAGTGSEVTRNAVLGSPEHGVKASLRSPSMLPRVAVIDPELTLSLPPALTASTGLDALTQLIEPCVSVRANAMTDMFCEQGIRRARCSLARAYADGSDIAARTDMSMASLLGGLSLANAGLGAVHGFAAPLGGTFDAPHGAVCAAVLPHAMEVNIRALRARAASSEALQRYERIAVLLTGDNQASAEDGAMWVRKLCENLHIPKLREYGVQDSDVPALVEKAARASSMKANPIVLTEAELFEIALRAL